MKKMVLVFVMACCGPCVNAQEQELEQLVLNIEKLAQFKNIFKDMKEGYELLTQGYEAVKEISEGNFNLHADFLNGLLAVSPVVKKYARIAEMIRMQTDIVKEYKIAWKKFRDAKVFSAGELNYLQRVYQQLLGTSTDHIGDLGPILTAGTLRMNDAERLKTIDALYDSVKGQLNFLQRFNTSTTLLVVQKQKAMDEVKMEGRMFGK